MLNFDHKVFRIASGLCDGRTCDVCDKGFSEPTVSLIRSASIDALPARPSRRQYALPGKQRGVVLFIALIALVALTLAGIALMRSVDTGNVIAGNLAFKQATLQASDIGTEVAVAALPNIIATSLDAVPFTLTATGLYYPTMRTVDANGVPTTAEAPAPGPAINWTTIPTTTVSGYNVQYVIDRLCQGPAPVNNVQVYCSMGVPLGGGSKKAGAIVFSAAGVVYYRVTVRVTGPRNAVSMVQTILSE